MSIKQSKKERIVWVTTCGHVWTTGHGQMPTKIAMALSLLIWHKTANARSKNRVAGLKRSPKKTDLMPDIF